MRQWQRTWSFAAMVLAVPVAMVLQAAPARSSSGQTQAPAIEIKIETFRKQLVPGKLVGVKAEVTNNSIAPVYLREKDVKLVLPPNLNKLDRGTTSDYGVFPTESPVISAYPPSGVICLKPNASYPIFCGGSCSNTSTEKNTKLLPDQQSWFRQFLDSVFIDFTPGFYPITVVAKYWDNPEKWGDSKKVSKKVNEYDYHTVVATKPVEYVAPQRTILLGAALGGVLFTILAWIRAEENSPDHTPAERHIVYFKLAKSLFKGSLIMLGSILLSVIITILMSRIAETQFFVRVTISDFWGAITVGFLANYGGWALLDKMVPPQIKGGDVKKENQRRADSANAQATNSSGTPDASGRQEAPTADAAKSNGPGDQGI